MTHKYPLIHPITVGSDTVTELNLREPLAKDLRGMPMNPGDQTWDHHLEMVARLAGTTLLVVDNMHAEDAFGIVELIQKKLAPGQ